GGARLVWTPEDLMAGKPTHFRFRAVDAAGNPTGDLEPYMGMLGHAAFIARDLSVFAHVHPTGSVPMAALGIVDPHASHHHDHSRGILGGTAASFGGHPSLSLGPSRVAASPPRLAPLGSPIDAGPSEVSFPYGLPKAGDYRVFVQIKRKGRIETAAF